MDEAHLRLVFNRDERIDRITESAIEQTCVNNAEVLFVKDNAAGGTWLSVNNHGLIVAITNAYPDHRNGSPQKSRGLRVLELADVETVEQAMERIELMDTTVFAPHHLFILQKSALGKIAYLQANWDGRHQEIKQGTSREGFHSVSSVNDRAITAKRAQQWHSLAAECSTKDKLALFSSQSSEDPSGSILMDRGESRTVSQSIIAVDQRKATYLYRPRAPFFGLPIAESLHLQPQSSRCGAL